MARYDFLQFISQIDTSTDSINLYDVFAPMWTDFTFTDNYQEYILDTKEAEIFQNVSLKFYNTIDYTDILYLINGLDNPFEIKPGTKIKIPTLNDINRFKDKLLNPVSNT